MIEILLQAVPNQSLTVTLDGARYTLTIKEAHGMMAVDIFRDEVELLRGHRIVAGAPLLGYRFLQDAGNFALLTENDELPYYASFGNSQQLVYLSAAEVAALRG